MRTGRFPEPTGDPRVDAMKQLRWAMSGRGLSIDKLTLMDAVRALPAVAAVLDGADDDAVPRIAYDVVTAAARDLGDGLHARLLRTSLAIGYAGSAKDLTARRLEFVAGHNKTARAEGSRNLLPETERAVLNREDQVLQALVTALSAPGTAPRTATTTREVPHQLPAAPKGFCGRTEALDWLDANALGTAEERGAPAVVAIHGTAGVGKTALALHWAHRVADAFPDGHLYVDLHGHARGDEPVRPAAALSQLLHALGVAPDALPASEDALAGEFRSATAGRKMLIVLDNAATTDQVVPLIPGEAGCVVVVTSRNALPALAVAYAAGVLTLDALAPVEATGLLDTLLGTDRTGADPDATADVAALCGYLPLALRIVAAKLRAEPDTTLHDMAQRLRASDRLTALRLGADDGVGVRAAFELSYDSLGAEERRAFRLLGLAPGPDLGHDAAAALLGESGTERLDRLAAAHLVGRAAGGRYVLHDLLRHYAAELCLATDDDATRDAAVERLLAHYVHRAADASSLLNPASLRLPDDCPETPAPPPLQDRETAARWLGGERQNLTAAVAYAAAHGRPTRAWQLAYAMRGLFLVGISGAEWLPVGEAGLAAAERTHNHHAASAMYVLLGRANRLLGDLPTAERHLRNALDTSCAAGWEGGEMIAECTLGGILQDQGRLAEAITHHQVALGISRRRNDPGGGAVHIANIGAALCQIGRYSDATAYCVEALDLVRQRGDMRSVALINEMLANIAHQAGKLDEAEHDIRYALAEFRQLGCREFEAEALSTLARIRLAADDVAGARAHALESLRGADELDDVRIQAVASNTLGEVAARAGDTEESSRRHAGALALADRIGYPFGRVAALIGLARAAGDGTLAAEAVAEARANGFLALEAWALNVVALVTGDRDAASRALDLHLACGSRLGADEAERLLAGNG